MTGSDVLEQLKAELDRFGDVNDRTTSDRGSRMLSAFASLVCHGAEFVTSVVPIGKGEFLAAKMIDRPAGRV